jgi:hypothetical protein
MNALRFLAGSILYNQGGVGLDVVKTYDPSLYIRLYWNTCQERGSGAE